MRNVIAIDEVLLIRISFFPGITISIHIFSFNKHNLFSYASIPSSFFINLRIVHSYLMLLLLLLWASIQFYFSVFIQPAGSNKTSIVVNAKAISENLNWTETKRNKTHMIIIMNEETTNHRLCERARRQQQQNTFAVHVKWIWNFRQTHAYAHTGG